MITKIYFPEDLLGKMLLEILSLMMTDSMNHHALPPAGSAYRFYVFTLTRFHAVPVN
jgi:hypothetical protein